MKAIEHGGKLSRHYLPAVAGCFLAAVLLSGCTSQQAAAPAAPPVPVVVAKVEKKNVPLELRAIGNVEALASVSLKSQVTGPVVAVLFREGQDVRKGDPLFEIYRRPFEVALQQAQADLARDRAKAENARVDADRYLKLFEQNIAPRQQYDAQRANADALDAAVLADSQTAIVKHLHELIVSLHVTLAVRQDRGRSNRKRHTGQKHHGP